MVGLAAGDPCEKKSWLALGRNALWISESIGSIGEPYSPKAVGCVGNSSTTRSTVLEALCLCPTAWKWLDLERMVVRNE